MSGDPVKNWIADGTKEAEPVTVETPAAETPVAETPAPAVEAAVVPAGEKTPEPEMFVGRVGEQEFKVPANFELPYKRGEDTEWVTITEAQKRGMLEKDYRAKTQEISEQRRVQQRESDRQLAEARSTAARHQAREQVLANREKQIAELVKDPDGLERYQEHLQQYRENPIYRQAIDRSLEAEMVVAERRLDDEAQRVAIIQEAAATAMGWITETSKRPEFAGVDPERVRAIYSRELQAEVAPLDPREVERIFRQEAEYREQTIATSPLRRELEDLKAQVASVKAEGQARAHNSTVQRAMERSKTPNVAPAGSPAVPGGAAQNTPFGPRELDDRVRRWARGGS